MAEAIAERVRRYILDGSDEDLRRLLGVAESTREMARSAFRRVGMQEGWHVIDCGCGFGDAALYWIQRFQPGTIDCLNISWSQVVIASERTS
jgi:cyclopropane fatty-acyl-phospholipid synthase-like methyltransferase